MKCYRLIKKMIIKREGVPGIRYTPNHQPNLKESLQINVSGLFYCNVFDLYTVDLPDMLQLYLEIVHFLDE